MSKVILFDGDCHFCDKSVQFIIKQDPKAIYKFASLQSQFGIDLRRENDIPKDIDSLVLIENQTYYLRSTAALHICRNLKGFWRIFHYFLLIPAPLRDSVYNLVAKNRYRWFGKKISCEIPSPEIRKRFL